MAHPGRVLIYRLGSLGDMMVALPCFHLVARTFAEAQRCLLTNLPADPRAASPKALLSGSDLVGSYIEYPLRLRNVRQMAALQARIRRWAPRVLVYLTEPRGRLRVLRDALFFKCCGIARLVGVPYAKGLQENRFHPETGLYEHETERLARCITALGDARPRDPRSWDLHLSAAEISRARRWLEGPTAGRPLIAFGVGTKVDVKNWGCANWQELATRLSSRHTGLALVLVGGREDFSASAAVAASWRGPALNMCGKLTVRECAAVLRLATLFVGHDSGPMHLAASAGVHCVAVFSARSKPGVWFPYGPHHKVIYHKTECSGCQLDHCRKWAKRCIASISVGEVIEAVERAFDDLVPGTLAGGHVWPNPGGRAATSYGT